MSSVDNMITDEDDARYVQSVEDLGEAGASQFCEAYNKACVLLDGFEVAVMRAQSTGHKPFLAPLDNISFRFC